MLVCLVTSYIIQSGISQNLPFNSFYHFIFVLIFSPAMILISAIFYTDFGFLYYYRIFGQYMSNFTYNLIENENLLMDIALAVVDFIVFFYLLDFGHITGISLMGMSGEEEDWPRGGSKARLIFRRNAYI